MTLTFISLFAGIGGIDLGLERAGLRCVAQVELDDYCTRVLAKHWPHVQRFRDVRSVGAHNLPRADVIAGGFPCQDISSAGRGAGITGTRSGLWMEFARIIRELRPRYVLVENVAALLYRGIGTVLGDLATLGYGAEWHCIPAAAIGAPHIRDRVYIVAYAQRNRWQQGAEIFRGWQPVTATGCEDASNASIAGVGQLATRQQRQQAQAFDADGCGQDVPDADQERCNRWPGLFAPAIQAGITDAQRERAWCAEPDVGGAFDGFPGWLERFIGRGMSYEARQRAIQALRKLWNPALSAALWEQARGLDRVSQAQVLFSFVRQYEKDPDQARLLLARTEASQDGMRSMRRDAQSDSASHRSGQSEQHAPEHSDAMQMVPQLLACDTEAPWLAHSWEDGVARVATGVPARVDRLKGLGNAVVPQIPELIGRAIVMHHEAHP